MFDWALEKHAGVTYAPWVAIKTKLQNILFICM